VQKISLYIYIYRCFLFYFQGLHYIFELSSQNITELRIDVEAADGTKAFEVYRNFSLDEDDYRLHIDKGYGTAGAMFTCIQFFMIHNSR
jgi:hypothetical protein